MFQFPGFATRDAVKLVPFSTTGLSPSLVRFSAASSKFPSLLSLSHDPKFRGTWFRLFPFRSPLLGESLLTLKLMDLFERGQNLQITFNIFLSPFSLSPLSTLSTFFVYLPFPYFLLTPIPTISFFSLLSLLTDFFLFSPSLFILSFAFSKCFVFLPAFFFLSFSHICFYDSSPPPLS